MRVGLPRKRELAALLLYYSGVVHLVALLRRGLNWGGPIFLTGHRVLPATAAEADPVDRMALLSRHAITPEELEARLAFLQRWVAPCGDPDELRGGLPTRRAFYLTFDDGYLDNLAHGVPVLARMNVRAVIFLVADLVARPKGVPWWDRWGGEALEGSSKVEEAVRSYNLRCAEAKRACAGLTPADLAEGPTRRYLTQAEVDALPVAFYPANHTKSHANLCAIDAAQIGQHIAGGETPLASHPRRLPVLAYPFGNHDARVLAEVRQAGQYRIAFATGAGAARDPLRARRINLNVAGLPMFAAQCAGLLH